MSGYRLNLVLQPIVDVVTGRVKHYEALMRIDGHVRYASNHVAMLFDAEAAGWIHELDAGVLIQAIHVLRRCPICLAVNLSPRTLEVSADMLLRTLGRAVDVADRLILEITETAQIKNLPAVCRFVVAARELGCAIAVDDYGSVTGFFTDEIVKAIKPEFLKLDRHVMESAVDRVALLASAFELSNQVGAELIAEFIDSPAKESLVSSLGIRYAQGYLYGVAKPWQSIEALGLPAHVVELAARRFGAR